MLGTVMSNLEQEKAILCSKLSKEFYIINENLNWRIVFHDNNKPKDSFNALTDINLVVPKGKFVGILGRNGAGKSTLLRVLAGVYAPTQGIVNVTGEINSLFEMGGFGNNRLTGRAYADRFLQIQGINKADRPAIIKKIKDFSELEDDFNKPIYTYSSGMSARLYFSTATEIQHEIYLVDELLSVGDAYFQAKCWKRLRERFSNGASGILVTHDWSAVLKLCEYSYILDKGHIIASGPSENMVQQYLRLPVPSNEYAEIITNPQGYSFESGKDCDIKFDILLKKQISLAVSYSVELFRAGCGWEILLLNKNFVTINAKIGLNPCHIKIKQLPLVSGEYYLNLFIKSVNNPEDNLKLEGRSWTFGNGIKIRITGKKTEAITVLPWTIQVGETSHVAA